MVALTIARLTPDEKFDPFPLFLAMEAAAPALAAKGAKLHLVLCGQFSDKSWQPVFAEASYVGRGVSDRLFENGLCLPSGSNLSDADLDFVISSVVACWH